MFEMRFNYFPIDGTLPFYIQFGGHDSYMFAHTHVDFYELVLVTGGTAEHVVDGGTEQIKKGDVFVIGEGNGHAYENPEKLRIINLMFRSEALKDYEEDFSSVKGYRELFSGNTDDFKSRIHLSPADFDDVLRLLTLMEREYAQRKQARKAFLYSYFVQLVITLSRLYGMPVKKREISGITAAAAYLDEHYMEEQPLKSAIELSNYSRRHFCRLFTEVYGFSPQDYLFEIRMRRGADLLRSTGMSVAETAAKCGFSDSGYFTRVFKKRFGVLPSRYRAGKE